MRSIRLAVAAGFLGAGAAWATWPLAGFRPALADDAAVARVLAASEAEARAQWEKRLPELVGAFESDPQSPYTFSALRGIQNLIDECRGRETVEQRLDPILARGVRDGELDEQLREVLAARARARGDYDRARSYDTDRGYLRRWAAVGPLGWSDASLVHRRYGPEDQVLDPKATWLGARRKVGWTALEPDPDSGWVDPWNRLRDAGNGIWYAVARVRSAGPRGVALKIICSDSFKVFVNGRETIVADRERDEVPSTVFASAALVDGWNRILVKVTGRSQFALKLCDEATGLPAEGLEEGDPLEPGACPDPGPAPQERAYRTPVERVIAEGLASGASDPARLAAAAGMAADDSRTWDAYRLYEKAAAAAATGEGGRSVLSGNVHAWRGHFLAGFGPFPAVQRKLRAQQEFGAALAAFPDNVSAAVRLAEYENEDDHPDKAVKALREALKRGESVNGWMSFARIAKARGWDPEAVDAAKKALAVQPLSGTAIEFLNDVDRKLGDHAEVEKRHRALLEIDRSDGAAAQALIGDLRAQGKHADALKMIDDLVKRWPRRHGWKRMRADTLSSLGRDDDALAQLKSLEPLLPQDEGVPRKLGEILEVRGDAKGALECYRRSLAVEPFQPALWRVVTRLEGKEEDFAAGWEPDVKETLAAIPSTEDLKKKYPKAVAVTVLDHSVVRVNPDGSSRNYVHMIYKVLDEKGVEKHADVPNMGETLQVRAILPDGTVTTPTGMRGRSFNIEGLVPGTVLDHRYVVSQRSTPKGYDGGTFWFQDTDIDDNPSPVLLSRWVVITPEGTRIEGRKLNYTGEPKVETKDGFTATVWEQKDLPLYEAERNRPRNEELFCHVDYSIPKSFEDAPWELFTQRADSRGSPMIDEAVAQCVKPGMSDIEKLRAIHAYVNREVTGDAGSGSGATAVLLEKSGSRDLLFEAMTRSAGIRYRLGRALAWNGAGQKLADQEAEAFSGSFLWLEPKNAEPVPHFARLGHHAPFGLVPEAYRQSAAFLLDESGGLITRVPSGGLDTDDSSEFRIRLSADPKATTIEGTLHYRSPNGYGFKRTLVDMSGDDRKKFAEGQFSSWFANPKLETYTLPKLDERGQPLDIALKGTMSTYVEKQGENWVVALGLPESNMARRYVDKAERQFDLVLQSRDDRRDEFTIDLGDAWDVRSLPEDHTAVHDVGTYSLTWRREGSVVRVRRERHLHPARYRPAEYKAFVAWCKAIDDAEDRKLELRKR